MSEFENPYDLAGDLLLEGLKWLAALEAFPTGATAVMAEYLVDGHVVRIERCDCPGCAEADATYKVFLPNGIVVLWTPSKESGGE